MNELFNPVLGGKIRAVCTVLVAVFAAVAGPLGWADLPVVQAIMAGAAALVTATQGLTHFTAVGGEG